MDSLALLAAEHGAESSRSASAREPLRIIAPSCRELRVPTLVIHGLDDTLIDPSGGKRTAELVPGAELLLLPDMGHDRPVPLWPEIIDALEAHTS